MANIRYRNGAYLITVSLGYDENGKKRIATTTYHPKATTPKALEREVRIFADNYEERIKSGRFIQGGKVTFSDYIKTWDRDWASQNLTERAREGYMTHLNKHVIPKIGDMILEKIYPSNIQNIITEMIENGYSPKTIKTMFVACHSVIKHAYQMDVIKEDPCLRCRLPKIPKDRDIHCFNIEQAKTFLEYVRKGYPVTMRSHSSVNNSTGKTFNVSEYTQTRHVPLQFQALYYLAVYGGFRRGELLALTWEDVDFKNRTVEINKAVTRLNNKGQLLKDPKTEASYRIIKLPQICFDILKEWKNDEIQLSYQLGTKWEGYRGKDFDKNFIFIQSDSGKMMSLSAPYDRFKEIISHVKNPDGSLYFPQITFHELRHTSATLMIASGVDVSTVSHRLGHSRTSVTLDIYTHALDSNDDVASSVLESCLG